MQLQCMKFLTKLMKQVKVLLLMQELLMRKLATQTLSLKDQTTTVEGGKTLTFTAVPVSADFMVAGWYVNGKKVENELSNTCH